MLTCRFLHYWRSEESEEKSGPSKIKQLKGLAEKFEKLGIEKPSKGGGLKPFFIV